MLPWTFQIPLWNGLRALKFSLKPMAGVHKRDGKLMVSVECETVLCLFHTGNTVLIVAHASSLEACTRHIRGLTAQNSKDFVQVVRKVISPL